MSKAKELSQLANKILYNDGTNKISIDSVEVPQSIFKNIAVAGQADVVADGTADTLTLVAGTNMTLTTNAGTDTITLASSGSGGTQNLFSTIAVAGQNSIVADSTTDTLTLAAGTGITLTTDQATDTLTITSSAGSGTLSNIVEDTTPQLGGDLDLNSNNITGTGNIPAANLTGVLPALDGSNLTSVQASSVQITESSDDNTVYNVLFSDTAGSGNVQMTPIQDDGGITFNPSDNTLTTGNLSLSGTLNSHTIPSGSGTLALTSDISSAYSDSSVDTHLNTSTANSGEVLSWTGTDYDWVAQSGGGGGGTPAGSDTYVQFNSSGSFGADSDFTYNQATNVLTVGSINATASGTPTLTSNSAINMSVGSSVIIQQNSGGGGFRLGNMTTTQRNALAAANGEMVYNTTDNKLQGYENGAWANMVYDLATDTTPTLGGDLDLGGNILTQSGSINFTGYTSDAYFQVYTATASQGNRGFRIGSSSENDWFIEREASNDDLKFYYNPSERFRFGSSGQFGVGGANYGTSGQVLTSGGPSAAPSWQTVSGGGSTDAFKTIAVSGQSDVVADSSTDTLTLVAGSNMTITTNASGDTITFASSGGGGGSSITVQDEGSALSTAATTLNFVGGGVVASGTGATKTITISGNSSSTISSPTTLQTASVPNTTFANHEFIVNVAQNGGAYINDPAVQFRPSNSPSFAQHDVTLELMSFGDGNQSSEGIPEIVLWRNTGDGNSTAGDLTGQIVFQGGDVAGNGYRAEYNRIQSFIDEPDYYIGNNVDRRGHLEIKHVVTGNGPIVNTTYTSAKFYYNKLEAPQGLESPKISITAGTAPTYPGSGEAFIHATQTSGDTGIQVWASGGPFSNSEVFRVRSGNNTTNLFKVNNQGNCFMAGGLEASNLTSGSYIVSPANSNDSIRVAGNILWRPDGANSTGVKAGARNVFNITAPNQPLEYTFNDPDAHWFPTAAANPELYLRRGETYYFVVNASGHPLEIRTSINGSAVTTGITNNTTAVGTIIYKVPMSASGTHVYRCTSHGLMTGNIIYV